MKSLNLYNAHVWTKCPASLDYSTYWNEIFFEDNEIKERGIVFHNFMHNYFEYLTINKDFSNIKKEYLTTYPEFEEWLIFVNNNIDYDLRDRKILRVLPELKIQKKINGVLFSGRIDLLIETENSIHIYDYKTGYNEIRAFGNPQLIIPAYLIKYQGRKIYGTILQPSLNQRSDIEIVPEKNYIPNLIKNIKKEPRKHVIGGHCKSCEVKDICKEMKKKVKQFLNPKYLDLSIDRIKQWDEILEFSGPMIAMLKSVEMYAKEAMKNGITLPNHSLVVKDGKRKWNNNLNASIISKKLSLPLSKLKVDKIKEPSEIEKMIKKNSKKKIIFDSLISNNKNFSIESNSEKEFNKSKKRLKK